MAIDTAAKRRSAACTRRLPWFRRLAPISDGSMTQADRQQTALVYGGILAGAEAGPTITTTAVGFTRLGTDASGDTRLGTDAVGFTRTTMDAEGET